MTFAHPALAILSALSLPAAFAGERFLAALRRRNAYAYSHLPFMTAALKSPQWPCIALDLAYALAVALLLAAAAGPRLSTVLYVPAAIVFCIDTSGSMNARDVVPSRARAVAIALQSFAAAMPPGTRAGLVSFAGKPHRIVALSGDRGAIIAALARIPLPNGQTAIGDGLMAAASLLPSSGTRAIVLMTDGTNNHGEDPRDAIRTIASSHIRLDAVLIGDAPFSAPARSYVLRSGGVFVRAGNTAALTAQMVRLAKAGLTARAAHDFTEACAIAAFSLWAAAWLAAAGASRL